MHLATPPPRSLHRVLRGAWLPLVLAPLLGCGTYRSRGLVGRVDVGCGGDRPLAGASVRVQCPGEAEPRLQATSDSRGLFAVEGEAAAVPRVCSVVVERRGYTTRTYAVSELCADESPTDPLCSRVGLVAHLNLDGGAP